MRAVLDNGYSQLSETSVACDAVLLDFGQPDEPQIVDRLADIGEVTIEFETPKDAQYNLVARGAGTTSIEHPQDHPSSELASTGFQPNRVVQEAPPFSAQTEKRSRVSNWLSVELKLLLAYVGTGDSVTRLAA